MIDYTDAEPDPRSGNGISGSFSIELGWGKEKRLGLGWEVAVGREEMATKEAAASSSSST